MTTKEFKARRDYYFRDFVARKDHAVCKRGEGPFHLTSALARRFWAEATAKARWYEFTDR